MKRIYLLSFISFLFFACNNNPETDTSSDYENENHTQEDGQNDENSTPIHYEKESNLKNIKQLTFGGDNAEAYFSYDNQYLVFQATNQKWNAQCDQIFYMPIDGYER